MGDIWLVCLDFVAPLAGAWIEIFALPAWQLPRLSLPSRERGLKSCLGTVSGYSLWVAPLAGAWIEMQFLNLQICRTTVAPLAGAWIEIVDNAFTSDSF